VSDSEPNESGVGAAARAYRELELLVGHLTGELAAFRRRALAAEARLKSQDQQPGAPSSPASPASAGTGEAAARVAELERENAELRRRLEQAGARTRQLLERVRFLRQQQGFGGSP